MKKYSLPLIATALLALSQSPLYGMYNENSFINTEENNFEIPEPADLSILSNIPSNNDFVSNSSLEQTVDLENKDLIHPSFGLGNSENINNAVPTATKGELNINNLFSNVMFTSTTDTVPVHNLTTPQNSKVLKNAASSSKKHPRENSKKRVKNQSKQKKTRPNNHTTNSTNSSSNSSQSIAIGSSSSSSSITNTWTGYPPSHWNQARFQNHTISMKAQLLANFFEDAGTSKKKLGKIKAMLTLLDPPPKALLKWFLNSTKKSKESVTQLAINKNNTMGLTHLKFILNLLNDKIQCLINYPNLITNYQFLAKKLTECTTDNTTLECSELVKNIKNTINNNLNEKLSVQDKASKIFDTLNKLLNNPTQLSNSVNASSSSQNQLLSTTTPRKKTQKTKTKTQTKNNNLTTVMSNKELNDLMKMVNRLPSIFPMPDNSIIAQNSRKQIGTSPTPSTQSQTTAAITQTNNNDILNNGLSISTNQNTSPQLPSLSSQMPLGLEHNHKTK